MATTTGSHRGFELDTDAFVAWLKGDQKVIWAEADSALDEIGESAAEGVAVLVWAAFEAGAVSQPGGFGFEAEAVVYPLAESGDAVLVAVRPAFTGGGPFSVAVSAGQVASDVLATSGFGPRDGHGARERGLTALAGIVADVLSCADDLLPALRKLAA